MHHGVVFQVLAAVKTAEVQAPEQTTAEWMVVAVMAAEQRKASEHMVAVQRKAAEMEAVEVKTADL